QSPANGKAAVNPAFQNNGIQSGQGSGFHKRQAEIGAPWTQIGNCENGKIIVFSNKLIASIVKKSILMRKKLFCIDLCKASR
ncbi:MAG: hypothetical protein R6X34_11050, partial [Chloroflexota bacterium]